MPVALSPRLLLPSAVLSSAVIFGAFAVYERPGLGIAHFYYLSIALAAMAVGPRGGALAGLTATGLYFVGALLNPEVLSHAVTTGGTVTRGVSYVTIGTLVGWFASRNRSLVGELRTLAERDMLTGLPNTRAFEAAITLRLESGKPFALMLADMDALRDFNREEGFTAGNDALRRLAERLASSLSPDDDVARVGSDEFVVLAKMQTSEGAAQFAAHLERILVSGGTKATVGWALHPREGENALALYRAASERLYARKMMRSYIRPTPQVEEVAG